MANDDTPVSWVRNVEVETDTPVEGVVTGLSALYFLFKIFQVDTDS